MKLSELIAKYGDDIVQFQKMDDCATMFNKTKEGTKATICTPVGFGFDGFDKMGLVIWMDRERVQKILDADKGK